MRDLARIFPRKTQMSPDDEDAYFDIPDLFTPRYKEAHVSVTFTWDIEKAAHLAKQWETHADTVLVGGPAIGGEVGIFEPGLYLKTGVTITSRGCPRRCPWCLVDSIEGHGLREIPVRDGWILQDNNILACSREHREEVYQMLGRQIHPIRFLGGIDSRLLTEWDAEMICGLHLGILWLACDSPGALRPLRRSLEMLSDIPRRKKGCFVMIGFGKETPKDAEMRISEVWKAGAWPKVFVYTPPEDRRDPPRELIKIRDRWNNPVVVARNGAWIDNGGDVASIAHDRRFYSDDAYLVDDSARP